MAMPTSQKTLLDQAITRVDQWRTAASAVDIELVEVSMIFPPLPPDTGPGSPVTFRWDETAGAAGEFRVDT